VFSDLSIRNAINADASKCDRLITGRDIHKRFTCVRLGLGPTLHHFVTLGHQIVGGHVHIGK
jgi:hypothetical protein